SAPPDHPGGIATLPGVDGMKAELVAALKEEIEKPWAGGSGLPGTPTTISVSRRFAAKPSAKEVERLEKAAPLVARRESRIIEIEDNGPLYEPSLLFSDGSHVLVRAAKGYRPMLVWDPARSPEAANAFMRLAEGSLTLEGLDIVLKCSRGQEEPLALISVTDGDFEARGCSFSVIGNAKGGLSAVRFDGKAAGHRCRLSNCVVRGSYLSTLDVQAPGAEVLIDNSLLIGGERPLLQVAAAASPTT